MSYESFDIMCHICQMTHMPSKIWHGSIKLILVSKWASGPQEFGPGIHFVYKLSYIKKNNIRWKYFSFIHFWNPVYSWTKWKCKVGIERVIYQQFFWCFWTSQTLYGSSSNWFQTHGNQKFIQGNWRPRFLEGHLLSFFLKLL